MSDNPSPTMNGLTKYKVEELQRLVADLSSRVNILEKELIKTRAERQEEIGEAKSNVLGKVDELEDHVHEIDLEMAKLGTRLTIFQGIQAIFTTIAGVIATIVGRI